MIDFYAACILVAQRCLIRPLHFRQKNGDVGLVERGKRETLLAEVVQG